MNKLAEKVLKECGTWAGSDFEAACKKYGIKSSDAREELSKKIQVMIEKQKEKTSPRSACVIARDFFADAVFHNGGLEFLKIPNDGSAPQFCNSVRADDGREFLPPSISTDRRLLKLPTIASLQKAESAPALFEAVKKEVAAVWDAGPEQNKTLFVLWLFASYRFDLIGTAPYLRLRGPAGCGKTRGLNVLAHLTLRPLKVGPSLTEAVLFRLCDIYQPCACINEFDIRGRGEYASLMLQLLNSRWERGFPIPRMGGENRDVVEMFEPFGATTFAARAPFSDLALESKTLDLLCEETDNENIPEEITPEEFEARFAPLRDRLYMALRLRPNTRINSPLPRDLTMPRRFRQVLIAIWNALPPELLPEMSALIQQLKEEERKRIAATDEGEIWLELFEAAREAASVDTPLALSSALVVERMGWADKGASIRAGWHLGRMGFSHAKTVRGLRLWKCERKLWERTALRLGELNVTWPWAKAGTQSGLGASQGANLQTEGAK